MLLVSPIDPEVPGKLKFLMGGENTYTRVLLASPPPSVEYVHHLDAFEKGEIRYGPFHNFLRTLTKFRMLPLSAGTFDIEVSGDFDLIHCHAYTLRLSGESVKQLPVRGTSRHPPVVLGDSVPTRWALSAYFKQSPLRIGATYALRNFIHRMFGVYDQNLFLANFPSLVVISEFAKKKDVKLGADIRRITLVYPGLADRGERKTYSGKSVRILFAGVWIERKGGLILWEAYRRVRERFGQKVKLTILGPLPKNIRHKTSDIRHRTSNIMVLSNMTLSHMTG